VSLRRVPRRRVPQPQHHLNLGVEFPFSPRNRPIIVPPVCADAEFAPGHIAGLEIYRKSGCIACWPRTRSAIRARPALSALLPAEWALADYADRPREHGAAHSDQDQEK